MINKEFEKEYDEKLRLHQQAIANTRKYEEKHPAVTMGPVIQYPSTKETEEHSRLLELEDSADNKYEEARKKFFGDK